MRDTEINRMVAEYIGWTELVYDSRGLVGLRPQNPSGLDKRWVQVPDFTNDLNAIHEACVTIGPIKLLNWSPCLRQIVLRDCDGMELDGFIPDFWFYNATAKQRSEALVICLDPTAGEVR